MQQADLNETERYIRLIYTCCPLFKAPEFRDVYTAKEPYDVVEAIYSNNVLEFSKLTEKILNLYGFGVEADIKK